MIKYAFAITGAVIGAGFISGAEIYQFFSRFGVVGIFGFLVSALLLYALAYVVMSYSIRHNAYTFDGIVSCENNKVVKALIIGFEFLTYASIYVIMTAGFVSILRDLLNFESIIVPLFFCVLVTAFSILGVKSIATFFSVAIPLMLLGVILIAINSLFTAPIPTNSVGTTSDSWLLSSILYASYNFLAGIGVYVSLARSMKRKRSFSPAIILSFFFILILGVSIIIPTLSPEIHKADPPMLSAARQVSLPFYYVYAVLLLLAMFGASVSSLLPIVDWHKISYPQRRMSRVFLASLVSLVSVIASTLGFKSLVEHVYTYLGYLGLVFLSMVVYNCLLKEKLNIIFRRKQ